jgi:hypothetical protein
MEAIEFVMDAKKGGNRGQCTPINAKLILSLIKRHDAEIGTL